MHCLVTGGAGFIGSHVVDELLGAGHTVAVLDNLSTGKRENLNPAARFHLVDLRDAEAVARVVSEEQPAVICHQAALCDVRASVADPAGYAQVNIIGTLNLLQAASARTAGSARRFILASSGGTVYGEPEAVPIPEDAPTRPLDPYGASKLACEQYLFTYQHNYGLETVVLRYANVYGPRQDPRGEAGVVAIFTGAMLDGRDLIINGDGLQQRDFVFVKDVARANVLAVERGQGAYNIGTGRPTNVVTVYRELAAVLHDEGTHNTRPVRHGPAKPGEARRNYLDVSKASRELGWEPQVPLREGLLATIRYFEERAAV